MLLHELGHVEGDERVLATEEELGERLGKLGLAHARGSQEDERAAGATRVLERGAAATDGLCHLGNGLLLPDNALVQSVLAAQQLRRLGLGEIGNGNARYVGDNVSDVRLVDHHDVGILLLSPCLLELGALRGELLLAVAQARRLLELLRRSGLGLLVANAMKLLIHLGELGRQAHLVHARARTRLIDDVDCLVRQEAILHVPVGEGNRRGKRGLRVLDVVVFLVGLLQAMQDLERVLRSGLADIDGLEATLEGRVLLDVLAVLVRRGGTDDLNLSTREGRLENGRRVDRALSRTRAYNGVDLVDEKYDGLVLHDLGDNLLHALLELATIL